MRPKKCLDTADCLKIDEQAYFMAHNWYRDGMTDFTLYKGISLGNILEFETMVFFIEILKTMKLLKRMSPGEKLPKTKIISPIQSYLKKFKRTMFNLKINLLYFLYRQFFNFRKGQKIYYFDPYTVYYSLPQYLGLKNFFFLGPKFKEFFFNKYKGELRKKLSGKTRRIINDVLNKASLGNMNNLVFEDVPIWPSIKEIFKKKFIDTLDNLIVNIELTIKFFREYEIRGTILPWDQVGLYKIFACVGKTMGIETFRYQDGVLGEFIHYVLPTSEKILVWGEAGKRYYLTRGIDEKRLKIIGYPGVDNLKKWVNYVEKDRLKREVGVDKKTKIVLFAGISYEGTSSIVDVQFQYSLLETICQTAKKMPNIQFIIKLHGQTQNNYRTREIISTICANNIILFDNYNFYKLLVIADILVASISTVVLEAILMKIPVIILELDNRMAILDPYRKWPGVFYAEDAEGLKIKIKEILEEGKEFIGSKSFEKARKFVEDYIGKEAMLKI